MAVYNKVMKVYFASDHAGFALKQELITFVGTLGHETEDLGPHTFDAQDDYPDFVMPLARRVAQEPESRGIILGLSGQGEAMAANRIKHARAVVYYGGPKEILELGRQHGDTNILSLSAQFLLPAEAQAAVALWLATPFSGDERHVRRLAKIDE